MVKLIEEFKEIRKEKGVSLVELAKLTGIDKGTISKMERGESKISLENYCALIGALGYKLLLARI